MQNPTLEIMENRYSLRQYADKPITSEVRQMILHAAMRAPTAGNMMLYSILDITDQSIKDKLAVSCDHQPFIAKAPMVLLFCADYQRWYDLFRASGVEKLCEARGEKMKTPSESDFLLAMSDATIAAQNAVIAAEALGLGSCYIGDIFENFEEHCRMLNLPRYAYPVAMLCIGYPPEDSKPRHTDRFDPKYIVFENGYRQLTQDELLDMVKNNQERVFSSGQPVHGAENFGQHMYLRKYTADFSIEAARSVRELLKNWKDQP